MTSHVKASINSSGMCDESSSPPADSAAAAAASEIASERDLIVGSPAP
jgi:hypothetical protein